MTTTHYRWNPITDNVLCEQDENGVVTAAYTQKPDLYGETISQHRDGETSYYHFDGQGSTRALTDETENVTDRYTYSTFGEEVASSGSTINPFRYVGAAGYYTDTETNDVSARARVYEPEIGRWLSPQDGDYAESAAYEIMGTNREAALSGQEHPEVHKPDDFDFGKIKEDDLAGTVPNPKDRGCTTEFHPQYKNKPVKQLPTCPKGWFMYDDNYAVKQGKVIKLRHCARCTTKYCVEPTCTAKEVICRKTPLILRSKKKPYPKFASHRCMCEDKKGKTP